MSIVGSNALAGASGQSTGGDGGGGGGTGYQIDRSLRFDDASNGHLRRTPSTAGNRKTWTLSFWIKRTEIGGTQYIFNAGNTSNGDHSVMRINSDQLQMYQYGHSGDTTAWSGGNGSQLRTSAKFRDPSAWMHIVVAMDTTQATQSDRLKYYIDGVLQTDFSSTSYPAQNSNPGYWNAADMQCIGGIVQNTSPSGQSDYYLAEVHMVDGQQLAASDFGEYDSNNVWQPKEYSGTYGPSAVSYGDNNQITIDSGNYYLNGLNGPNAFDGNSSTYIDCRLGSGSNNTTNIIFQPTGGIANVTKIRVNSNYADAYRINNGSWTNFSSGGSYTQIYSGSAFTLTKLEIRRTSNSGSNYGHRVTAYEINDTELVDIANSGGTGFYLDFSDNSSNSALGTDSSGASNNWTVNNISAADSDGTIYAEYTGSSNQYLRKSGQGVLPGSNGAFTIECHFYPHNTSVIGLFDGGSGQTSIMRNYPANTIAKQGGGSVSFAGDYTQNAWNHIAIVYTGSTGTDTLTVYVNGVSSGSSSGLNGFTPGSNFDIGTINQGGDGRFDGYIRNFRVTHSAVYTSAFTAPSHADNLTAITNTKLLVITTPTNGLTTDASVSNYTLTNNGSVSEVTLAAAAKGDSFIDTPTNYTASSGNNGGNYAVLNPLNKTASVSLTEGNLKYTNSATNSWQTAVTTFGLTSGKWYFEATPTGLDSNNYAMVGLANLDAWSIVTTPTVWNSASGYGYYGYDGTKYNNSSSTSYGNTYTNGDVIGVAVDVDAGKIWFSKNGTWQASGDPANGTNAAFTSVTATPLFPFISSYSNNSVFHVNFGAKSYSYTPPTGFLSLCTQNLPDPTIADPSTVMDVALYTGDGNSTQTIGGLSFNPDFIWNKARSAGTHHRLFDVVRGFSKFLASDNTGAEDFVTDYGYVTATSDTGFTVGQGTHSGNLINGNGTTFANWCWDAGTSNTTISAGSLNSTAYNQSAVWSGMCSPTPSINSFTNGFDGSTTTTFAGGISPGSYFTFTPTGGGITFTDKVRVYNGNVSGASYQYNGNSAQTFTANAWNTVATGGGTMTSFAVTRSGTDVHGWYAIEVDGLILVDQGATPAVNVPAVDSTCRTNQTAGFSIVSYTGNSVAGSKIGHNLNAQPSLIFLKNRDRSINWAVGHIKANTFVDGDLNLNTTNAKSTGYTGFFGADPTSSVFTVQGNYESNYNNEDYIAYCFAPVEGYSAFTSHTVISGTNFVYLGFRARLVVLKRTGDGTTTNISYASWAMFDTERDTFNEVDFDTILYANRTHTEGKRGDSSGSTGGTYLNIDILSNGIRFQSGAAEFSQPSDEIIVMAWAEHPFKTARAR